MSSFPLFPIEAARRPVAVKSPTPVCERWSALPKLTQVTPASKLAVRPAPEMVSSGVREIDALTGGLPRGCLTEVCGSASSGRTSFLLAVLAAATRRHETCALVDVSDVFDPTSAAKAGVDFQRLLWVRCGPQTTRPPRRHGDTEKNKKYFDRDRMEAPVEQALRVTDLLLQSGGFGLVMMDFGDVPLKTARRIPLTSWFRFRRAVEHTPTVLFVVTPAPCAQTCAALLLKVRARKKFSAFSSQLSDKSLAHTHFLEGLHVEAELLRSRLGRKPMQSVTAFSTKASGTG